MCFNSWKEFFQNELKKEYFQKIISFLNTEYENKVIYPPKDQVFTAFSYTRLKDTKVVIVGQDPYHERYQAMGMSFSVPSFIKLPPSLKNMYKEIETDLNVKMRNDGDLTYLAKQGVLLLNAILTVEEGKPLSHAKIGYEMLLQNILKLLDELNQPIVFILWGNFARSLKKYIKNPLHYIIEGNHPSPLSANRGGFFNGKYFSKANEFLLNNGLKPIDWKN